MNLEIKNSHFKQGSIMFEMRSSNVSFSIVFVSLVLKEICCLKNMEIFKASKEEVIF
jgi:hypothetical protein